MSVWPPSIDDFKGYFNREFVYEAGQNNVMDSDITKAINEAATGTQFNRGMFDAIETQKIAFLYLTAHLMVLKIQGAGGLSATPRGKGVLDGGSGVVVASGVGQANLTYQVPPERVAKSAVLLDLFRTTFGQRYMAMCDNFIKGNMAVVAGPQQANWFALE